MASIVAAVATTSRLGHATSHRQRRQDQPQTIQGVTQGVVGYDTHFPDTLYVGTVSPFAFLVWGKMSSHGRTECGELSFGRHCSSERCAMTVRIRSDDMRWVLPLSRLAEHSTIRGVYLRV